MVQKFMIEKSGVEKFKVQKSGVERSGDEKSGVDMSFNPTSLTCLGLSSVKGTHSLKPLACLGA